MQWGKLSSRDPPRSRTNSRYRACYRMNWIRSMKCNGGSYPVEIPFGAEPTVVTARVTDVAPWIEFVAWNAWGKLSSRDPLRSRTNSRYRSCYRRHTMDWIRSMKCNGGSYPVEIPFGAEPTVVTARVTRRTMDWIRSMKCNGGSYPVEIPFGAEPTVVTARVTDVAPWIEFVAWNASHQGFGENTKFVDNFRKKVSTSQWNCDGTGSRFLFFCNVTQRISEIGIYVDLQIEGEMSTFCPISPRQVREP